MSSRDNIIKSRRLFFALWPDESACSEIVRQFKRMPQYNMHGNKTVPSNLHITLHFIGNVDESMLACLQQAARTVHAPAFELKLDQPGYFSKPQVFWLGCASTPAAMQTLHRQLADALLHCGYQAETRPFSPHVTLMRKLRDPGDLIPVEPIVWPIRSFALVESIACAEGVIYQPLENYFLE
ncbi:MAG: 2,3-cyclic 3-phosphodiesterase [Pseudomonadota bacterium]|nr:2,3-cyclic 3-phosphodiesterase [Pseudomonadota bacterium]